MPHNPYGYPCGSPGKLGQGGDCLPYCSGGGGGMEIAFMIARKIEIVCQNIKYFDLAK